MRSRIVSGSGRTRRQISRPDFVRQTPAPQVPARRTPAPQEAPKVQRLSQVGVVHLTLRVGNYVLLGRRKNTGEEDGRFQCPAGHIDDESAVAAVIREAKEEAGIDLDPRDLRCVHVMQRRSRNRQTHFFFEASRWSGAIHNPEPDKCDGWDWYPLDALPADIIPFVGDALRSIQRGDNYSEHGWN